MEPTPRTGRFTDVRRVESTGSTNDDLMEEGRQGAPEGLVLVAAHQRAGRGRQGRTWTAPPGSGLLCSVLLRPPARVANLLTATVAVALLEAVESFGAHGVGIKWPNDLIVTGASSPPNIPDPTVRDERKLAGILAEADAPVGSSAASGMREPSADQRLLVVVGCGTNVATPTEMPAEMAERSVALDELVTPAPEVDELLARYLDALEVAYSSLLGDPDEILTRWRSRCVTIGRSVRVDLGPRELYGEAVGIDDEGRLEVEATDGQLHRLAAGDVAHVRFSGLGARVNGLLEEDR